MFSSLFADPIRALIFAAAHLFGGSLGGAIFAVSLAARFAFFPLTLRLARRAREQQKIRDRLEPEIARLKKRHARQPEKLVEAIHGVYRREGIQPVDTQAVLGGLARMPVIGGIYGALRSIPRLGSFAWIADLAKPNLPLALLVTAGSAASTYIANHGGATRTWRFRRSLDRRSASRSSCTCRRRSRFRGRERGRRRRAERRVASRTASRRACVALAAFSASPHPSPPPPSFPLPSPSPPLPPPPALSEIRQSRVAHRPRRRDGNSIPI